MRQYGRLWKYAKEGKLQQALIVFNVMMHSKIYQIAQAHKVDNRINMMKFHKSNKLINKVHRLVYEQSWDVNYIRRWIDKTPGDFARPLGEPKKEWRIYTRMILTLLEIFYRAKGTIQPWQHCGVSKRGLGTAWIVAYKVLTKWQHIYEFDIKGFFDQVNNQNVFEELGPVSNAWFNKMVNSKPKAYKAPTYMEVLKHFREKIKPLGPDHPLYKNHIIFKKFDISNMRPIEEQGALFRESWKGLGQENKGFPQGLNISPFASCLVLHKIMRGIKGLIMYMDDGLIYAKERQLLEARIRLFKERLEQVGLTVAEEKSHYLDPKDKRVKFLGVRYSNGILYSDTRKGTRVEFPRPLSKAEAQDLAKVMGGTRSERERAIRVLDWVTNKARSIEEAYIWAIRKGLMPNLIDRAFNPLREMNQMLSYQGEVKRRVKQRELRGIFFELEKHHKVSLNNISTYGNMYLLWRIRKMRKGRSIRKL